MLSRASPMLVRKGVRHITGTEVLTAGGQFGAVFGSFFVLAGGVYVLDAKIESKTNHLDTKLDTLAAAVNSVNVSVARIEEHIRAK